MLTKEQTATVIPERNDTILSPLLNIECPTPFFLRHHSSYNIVASTDEDLHEFSPTLTIGKYRVTAQVDGERNSVNVVLIEEKPFKVEMLFGNY
ncbi:MAG: hypothetical protein AB1742_01730 [bacterium]